jgi:hypothetical protein
MLQKIYSKINPNKLLHIINKLEKDDLQRTDLIPTEKFLQCSLLKLNKGKTFKPHKHIYKKKYFENYIAQESWLVIKGRVKCIFYDIDNTKLIEAILEEGDASFTFEGGHNYECLQDNTVVYEYKTGPYEGQELDKEFINEV